MSRAKQKIKGQRCSRHFESKAKNEKKIPTINDATTKQKRLLAKEPNEKHRRDAMLPTDAEKQTKPNRIVFLWIVIFKEIRSRSPGGLQRNTNQNFDAKSACTNEEPIPGGRDWRSLSTFS
jgi:hypothetical protein